MKKNFDDFKPKITKEMILDLFGEDKTSFKFNPKFEDGNFSIDMNELALFLISASVNMSNEILRQYHDWNNLD